jgi:prepilin peptidase CpaA
MASTACALAHDGVAQALGWEVVAGMAQHQGAIAYMSSAEAIWYLVIALTLLAAWTDARTRKIPNWLTVTGVLAGVAINSYFHGWGGAKQSLEGTGLALAVLLPLVLLRGLGAGDWKLMGAVGSFVGPVLLVFILVGSVLLSGLMAMMQMMRTRRVVETFRNVAVLVKGFFSFGLRPNPKIALDNPGLMKLPFGVAVAAATVACYCAARWGLRF